MKYIFSVEGNIGSGKSTLLKEMKTKIKKIQYYDVIYLQEPVDTWESFKDENGKNIIESFYENNEKFAFSFQMMAYISRLHQLKTTLKNNNNIIIITERSIHTDREVFAKMLYDQKNMSKIEHEIYNKWFDQFLEECKIDGIIYVNTSPIKCLQRINKRNRKGEDNMSIDYLKDCNTYHDNWIETSDIDNLILDGNENYGSRNYLNWVDYIKEFINSKIDSEYEKSFNYQFFLNHPFC